METNSIAAEVIPLSGYRPRWRTVARLGRRPVTDLSPTAEAPPAIGGAEADGAVEARDRLHRRLLGLADLSAAGLSLLIGLQILGGQSLGLAALMFPVLVVVLGKVQGLYDRDELLIRKTTVDEGPELFQLATLSTLVLWLLDEQLVGGALADREVVFVGAILFGLTLLLRRAARHVASRVSEPERCLYVGDTGSYARLQAKFAGDDLNAVLIGRVSMRSLSYAFGPLTDIRSLRDLTQWSDAQRLIVDPYQLEDEAMLDLVRAAKAGGLRVSLLPRVMDVVGTSVAFDDLYGLTVLGVRRFKLARSSRAVKRFFDLAGAALGLLAAGPVLAVLAIAIKLDSRGPVLFRQTRVGRDGKPFRICKFRTMCADAEALKAELRQRNEAQGGLFKIADDPRITRVGRLMRKTSLDELPQLLNVLRGEMSLVGPRPLVVDEDVQVIGWDRRRLELTPGMTGHWQILGSSRVPMAEMVKIDYLYVAGWSLWSDLKILVRTVPYLLARQGM